MQEEKNYHTLSLKLEESLKSSLFDQDFAIEMVAKHLVEMPFFHSKIRALFTFMGVPNCGKRYMAELLLKADARLESFQAFQMDQYNDVLSSEEPLSLSLENDVVAFVEAHPKALLFFEDIDKADIPAQLALYMLFSDVKKAPVDFSEVVVVMSTTRLSGLLKRADLQTLFRHDPLQAHTFLMERFAQEEISLNGNKERVFNAKLLSLLNEGSLIPFNPLSLTALIKIGAHSLHTLSYQFNQQSGVQMEYKNIDTFISLLTLSLAPYLNARYIQTKLPETLFNGVYSLLKEHPEVTHITYNVSLKAKTFVRDALRNQPLLLKKIGKQQWRISLEWSLHVKGDKANYTLKHARYAKEQLHVNTQDALCISEVTFQDIAGQERVKEALREVLTLFKEPERLKHFSMVPPKGMILYGPTGMGKKLLARAFAHEADMLYIVLRDADLFDSAKIRKAYAQAYSSAPAIVILEDIDVQGITSGVISTMNVAPVIEELDALTQSFETPLFTIVTLAQKDDIPDALIKTGRLDICIEVPKLDMQARRFFIEEILKMPHDANIDVDRVVRYISGMGGDALKRIGQEAALFAARKGMKEISEEMLLEQINVIKYGAKLENKQIRDIEMSMAKTAYHEAGHAVLSYVLTPMIKIEQVTVAPRSDALGFVSFHHDDYIDAISKKELFSNICILLAGRIAKMERFGQGGMESGAMNDLEVATMQAYAAIALFGMDEELGYINVSGIESEYDKELLSKKIEERLLVWMKNAQTQTEKEVKRLWPAIEAVALALLQKEMIDGIELKNIIEVKLTDEMKKREK